MKRILFFIESLAGGGAEKILADLACNLNSEKYEVTVCTVSDNGIYQDKVRKSCKYKTLLHREDYNAGGLRKVSYWVKNQLIYKADPLLVYKFLLSDDYDIEVAFVEGFATKLISHSINKKSKKIAWVHTDMNNNIYADRFYSNKSEHIETYKKYDEIICVSGTVKKAFEDKFQLYSSRIIYNPVDKSEIIKKSKESIDLIPDDSLQLVTVGRLVEEKGYIRLLKTINRLKDLGAFSLWIIGEGPLKDVLKTYINDNNLVKNVQLIGFTDNPYKYVSKADIYLCSSYAEGYSTAATEALILNKPVFTVECSGMKELFAGYHCGRIVSNTDRELEEMLKDLIVNSFEPTEFKADIMERASQFDFDKQLKMVEGIFNE